MNACVQLPGGKRDGAHELLRGVKRAEARARRLRAPTSQFIDLSLQATAKNLIPRAGTADEVAQGVLFMIQNDFVTGTTIDVDGGWLLS